MHRTMNQKLAAECLMHAAATRDMWKGMRAAGYGWTWDFYRGWLADARAFRLGTEFKAHGSNGLPKSTGRRAVFEAI